VALSRLIELGQQTLTDVRICMDSGEPLVRCQFLASEFYEALKRELRVPGLSPVERLTVMAAIYQCLYAENVSISPGAMARELGAAIAILQRSKVTPPRTNTRPLLRVIEGGLSRS
jgi:hypothetical protein